jgi:hypothetical protein
LLLLIGPGLLVTLEVLGYMTVRVFYHRFIEAWITSLNIDAMLGLRAAPIVWRAGGRELCTFDPGGGRL